MTELLQKFWKIVFRQQVCHNQYWLHTNYKSESIKKKLKFWIFHHMFHQYKTQLCFFDSKFVLSVENNFFELYFFRLNRFAHQLIELNFAMKRLYDWNFQSNYNQNQRWFLILIAIFWSVELIVFQIDFNSKIDFFQLWASWIQIQIQIQIQLFQLIYQFVQKKVSENFQSNKMILI